MIATNCESVMSMTVEEWIAVTPNPHQRDTAKRLDKAWHLRDTKPLHAHVWAARLPSGNLVKIDGHTRALGWATGKIPRPSSDQVIVHVVPARDINEAAEYYWHIDTKDAAKKACDYLYGALQALGKQIHSQWLLKTINGALFTIEQKRHWHEHIEPALIAWWPDIAWLDQQPAPVQCVQTTSVVAGLLTWKDHETVASFMSALSRGGSQEDGLQDAAAALIHTVQYRAAANQTQGVRNREIIAGITVRAIQHWEKGQVVKGRLRPLDWTPIRRRASRLN